MRGRLVLVAAAAVILSLGAWGVWRATRPDPLPHVESPLGQPLMDGLGNYRHPVTTRSAQAQRWFDQGLVLGYAFNQQAAEQAFLRAADLDPTCAMCWWGAAWVLGPTINSGMDPDDVPFALERIARAREATVEGEVSDVERAFVEALATRYQRNPPADRHELDEAYARAMRALIGRFPEDLDARTLFADALMNLHPWNYYDASGAARPWTPEIVTVLEKVIAEEPEHPGANPLYVYVTEPSTNPQRAVEAAQRLERIAPAAGHFLHLAAHVWFRTGRYPAATAASLRAVAADATWAATSNPEPGLYVDGYMPHHFAALQASAMMQGASGRALAAASEVSNRVDLDQSRQPGYEALQHAWAAPFFARVRFGRWDEILAEPAPPGDLPYPEAIWHFARGIALIRQQQPDEAKRELDALYAAAAHPNLRDATMWELNKLSDLLAIAERMLTAELAAQRNDMAGAISLLKEAVTIQDGLRYDEPPVWPLPVRQYLGALLLENGKPDQAQGMYEQDLARYPDNGWSLKGLELALEAQGKAAEAADAVKRRKAAFKDADVTIKASRF